MSNKFKFAAHLSERQRRTFAERLLRLAALLKRIPNKEYAHDHWATKTTGAHCGTTACALGHAAANPQVFPGLGLRWSPSSLRLAEENPGEKFYIRLETNDRTWADEEFHAVNYFGEESYDCIFSGSAFDSDTPTKNTVIKRIEKIARESYGYEHA